MAIGHMPLPFVEAVARNRKLLQIHWPSEVKHDTWCIFFLHLSGKGTGFKLLLWRGFVFYVKQLLDEVPVLTLEQHLELGTLSCLIYCSH